MRPSPLLLTLLILTRTGTGECASESPAPRLPSETAPPSAPEPSPDGAPKDDPELVEELLSETDDEAPDLAWLYSNADEYSHTDVAGTPIPAPGLPDRGGGAPRTWDPRWRKFGTADYVLTGVAFSANAASALIAPVPNRWTSTNSLDEWGRRTLSSDNYDSGRWAQDASDVLLSLNLAFPLIVDSLIVSYWYRNSPQVAEQIALIAVESLAVTSMLQGTTAGLASRERPYGRDCGTSIPAELNHCESARRYRSFFSGHASLSFTTAMATCSNHLRHDLFGSPFADGLTCGVAVASATSVALFRVVGRQHYLTDVMTGAVVGSLSGLAVPWLLHYGTGTAIPGTVSLELSPTGSSLTLGGVF